MSGEVQGKVTFEWMEEGFFLIQRVDLGRPEHRIKGIEVIGYERPFVAETSEEIKSRFLPASDSQGSQTNVATTCATHSGTVVVGSVHLGWPPRHISLTRRQS
jgi:hypothetical protein